MASLIPTLNSCLGRMTSGEKRFARRLEALLEDDYLIWYDIPLGSKRRYPDFIVLHPARGLLFLEVKDWKAEILKKLTHDSVELLTPAGMKIVANPIEQARQCAYQVVQQLERDPQLRRLDGRFQGKLSFPYGYGVVFTNISRAQFITGLPEEARSKVLPDHLLICKDEMLESADAETFQAQLWGMFTYQFGQKLSLPQIDRIRWHLYPEIRIGSMQGGLFDTNDPLPGTPAEDVPEIIRIMDLQQEQLARSLGEGHRVIHGVAGSGKTLILGYRCLHLAQQLHKPIVVLCFNITLAAHLRKFIAERGIQDRVQVYHFHHWCGEQLRTYHVPLVESSAPYWERQVTSVIQGVENGQIPKGQYGALMIDEGHDFEPEWLALVTQMVDPETNSLLLLYDDAQSIYRPKSALNFSLSSVGIQAKGRTTILRLNYRNTREILDFAYNYAKASFVNRTADEKPLIQPEAAGTHGDSPSIKRFESLADEIRYCIRCLHHWHSKGVAWQDIGLLYPGGDAGRLMARALTAAGIPFLWLSSASKKKQFMPAEDRINLMPIPSSKGLEFNTVVIVDSTFRRTNDAQAEELADDVRRLYVGITRARRQLLMSYHRQNELGQGLQTHVTGQRAQAEHAL